MDKNAFMQQEVVQWAYDDKIKQSLIIKQKKEA